MQYSPFLANVTDRQSFDNSLQEYLSTGYPQRFTSRERAMGEHRLTSVDIPSFSGARISISITRPTSMQDTLRASYAMPLCKYRYLFAEPPPLIRNRYVQTHAYVLAFRGPVVSTVAKLPAGGICAQRAKNYFEPRPLYGKWDRPDTTAARRFYQLRVAREFNYWQLYTRISQ